MEKQEKNNTSKEKHRLNIALSMDNPVQREAWRILSGAENRTNAICEAVCGYYKQKDFLETIRAMLREELKNVSISSDVKIVFGKIEAEREGSKS